MPQTFFGYFGNKYANDIFNKSYLFSGEPKRARWSNGQIKIFISNNSWTRFFSLTSLWKYQYAPQILPGADKQPIKE